MPSYAEKRHMPYSQKQLFDLVSDVESYGRFLPWCRGCRITCRDSDAFYADLIVGYKMFRERFSSRVTATEYDHIHVEYLSGPMESLSNHWRFLPQDDGSCVIDFYVDFELRNPLLKTVVHMFFDEAVKRMVGAFETRAKELYG